MECYAGHVKRGRVWLAQHFANTDSEASHSELTTLEPVTASTQVDRDVDDPYQDPDFCHAFDCIPNRMSDKAVALFLTYKGVYQNLSQGSVDGIRAAFKALWDKV
jgi:hypothetical protein